MTTVDSRNQQKALFVVKGKQPDGKGQCQDNNQEEKSWWQTLRTGTGEAEAGGCCRMNSVVREKGN